MKKIKVLIVDDSAVVRDILSRGLSADTNIEVVGAANDVYMARDMIVQYQPDVLTLDIEMPRMDGVLFLKKLMPQYPIPTIMVSSLSAPGAKLTLEALQHGAVDVVLKPSSRLRQDLSAMMEDLCEKVKAASMTDVSHWKNKTSRQALKKISAGYLQQSTDKLLALGASTGGTVALTQLISALPSDIPGTLVVQHMPPVFTHLFAERLNDVSQVEVKEAQDHDTVLQGHVFIAPGGFQMEVVRSGGKYKIRVFEGEKVNGHAPSVDILFNSVATGLGPNAVGAILTGMGRDGAQGLLNMRNQGAKTLSQDERTSVIYGMPKEAWLLGASEKQVALQDFPQEIIGAFQRIEKR